jgi:hypothetical protein
VPVEALSTPKTGAKSKSATGAGAPTFPDTGINASTLLVTGIEPASGPFAGGNAATVRGSGFTDQAIVLIGGNMVQPALTTLVDRNSLRVIVPAGRTGLADVTVQIDSAEATKPEAYTYNPFLLEPSSGSIAGGTSIAITVAGANFDPDVEVSVGGVACAALQLITPNQVRCKTPAGKAGFTDVVASWPNDPQRTALVAKDAFEYMDLTDTDHGGLSGGPISGTINVSVLVDGPSGGLLLPNALVILGDDPKGPYQGLTDAQGQITFAGDDLKGPVTVHVLAKCMVRSSIVAFDAQNVTVHLTPLIDPSCGKPSTPPSGGGRGAAGSLISGELIFPGANEFSVNSWDNVPEPRVNEVRVTYVFTTRSQYNSQNPSPALGGATARIVEESSPIGMRGYPYRIFARPAGLAVYALCGLERRDTGKFTPYVMGVARDVLTSPGEETTGIDLHMDIALDQEEQVALARLPEGTQRGPDQFHVQAHVDLGGQGVIVREVNGHMLDFVTSFTGGSLFRFFAQPALTRDLADARYIIVAGWYTSEREDTPPYTQVRRVGVEQSDQPIMLQDFLALPKPSDPLEGGRLPADRMLHWEMADPKPDMYMIDITGGDDVPAWSQLVPGALTATPIPDFSVLKGFNDISPGVITWQIRAVSLDGFDFNDLKYNQLSPRFWTHTSVDTFTMQR